MVKTFIDNTDVQKIRRLVIEVIEERPLEFDEHQVDRLAFLLMLSDIDVTDLGRRTLELSDFNRDEINDFRRQAKCILAYQLLPAFKNSKLPEFHI